MVAVDHDRPADVELLREWLGTSPALRVTDQISADTDLIISTRHTISRSIGLVRKLQKARRPAVLPVLLLVERGVATELLDPVLGDIHDIVWTPASPRELEFRIRSALRVRRLSVEFTIANSDLASYAHSISHDLRQPLRALRGFSGRLLQTQGPNLDERGQRYAMHIREAAERMDGYVTGLLRLSQLDSASMTLARLNISDIARQVVREAQVASPRPEMDIHVEEGLWALGDQSLIRLVVQNLIANAWKFTRDTVKPRIEIRREHTSSSYSSFEIRDNGCGFDQAYASKLFIPFQRLHSTVDYPGTGVGLATVQRIIRRHRGQVWAVGEPGVGATFCFSLPLVEPPAENELSTLVVT